MTKKITKSCISCDKDGHTYLECEEVPFFGLVAVAFGLPTKPFCGLTEGELARKCEDNLRKP